MLLVLQQPRPTTMTLCARAGAARSGSQSAGSRKHLVNRPFQTSLSTSSRPPQLHPSPHLPAASTMPALANSARAIARSWTQHSMPLARAGAATMQSRSISEVHSTSSFDSPFKGQGSSTKIPSFGAYKSDSKKGEEAPKLVSYFMVGTMGALASLGAKATVQGNTSHHPTDPQTPME